MGGKLCEINKYSVLIPHVRLFTQVSLLFGRLRGQRQTETFTRIHSEELIGVGVRITEKSRLQENGWF